MSRGLGLAAAAGGVALLGGMWAPWFHRRLSSVFAPVRAVRPISGWQALGGGAGVVILVTAVVAIGWALRRDLGGVRATPAVGGGARPSGAWLVLPGGLALVVEVGVTVARVGAETAGQAVITTTPALGLALAFGGAAAVVLAGLVALVRESAARA